MASASCCEYTVLSFRRCIPWTLSLRIYVTPLNPLTFTISNITSLNGKIFGLSLTTLWYSGGASRVNALFTVFGLTPSSLPISRRLISGFFARRFFIVTQSSIAITYCCSSQIVHFPVLSERKVRLYRCAIFTQKSVQFSGGKNIPIKLQQQIQRKKSAILTQAEPLPTITPIPEQIS